VTIRKSYPKGEAKRHVALPSGQEAQIRLSFEVPDPREALEPNGVFMWLNFYAGACQVSASGPAADLEKALVAALDLLRENR
jgi:hypothetical protein